MKKIQNPALRARARAAAPMSWSSQPMQQHRGADDGGQPDGGDSGKPAPKGDENGGKPDGGKDGEDSGTPPKPDPQPVDVTKSKAFKDEKKRADDAEAELQRLREDGMNDDEKAREAEKKTAVASAVTAKETELTDHYSGVVAGLQDQIIDSIVDGLLDGAGLDRKEYEDVIGSLDKTNFIKDDGSVDREKVKKTFGQITKAATSRPPRTGGSRATQDNGFGRYLKKD